MNATSRINPSPVAPTGALTAQQIDSWRVHGFALVDGLIPAELIERAQHDALDHFGAQQASTDFGSGGSFVFPSESKSVNDITLHPRLLGAVGQLLNASTETFRLTQADLWAKYGRSASSNDPYDNDDQRIHVDYPNHSLTHPPPWDSPDAVEMIIYLSDVDQCEGATRVVPRTGDDDPAYPWPIIGTPGVAGLQWMNDRVSSEQYLNQAAPPIASFRADHLYSREQAVRYRPGTVLLYRHDTWHRGTPLKPGALRVVMNLTFRDVASEWISTLHQGWAWSMYRRTATMEQIITNSSVEQRNVLGFPIPASRYWNDATVDAVKARYPGIDMTPYEAG